MKRFKNFMKEYDFNKKPSKKPAKNPDSLKEDLEIPFVGKELQGNRGSFFAQTLENLKEKRGNSIEELTKSPNPAENTEKLVRNKEFSEYFREKWAKTQQNKQKPEENTWVSLKKVEKRVKAFSLSSSGFSSFHKGNLSEEKDKINKILMETLKIQQAKQFRKKNLGISFKNLSFREKFQGNRYNSTLLQNFCSWKL